MLNRFICYQIIIENLTIRHRSLVNGLSQNIVQKLNKLIFMEDDWNHLEATRNILLILYQACQLLCGKKYPTLCISYVITRGLSYSLIQPSSSRQSVIENVIKKYLYDAFLEHFDRKITVDQKNAMLVCIMELFHFFSKIEYPNAVH